MNRECLVYVYSHLSLVVLIISTVIWEIAVANLSVAATGLSILRICMMVLLRDSSYSFLVWVSTVRSVLKVSIQSPGFGPPGFGPPGFGPPGFGPLIIL